MEASWIVERASVHRSWCYPFGCRSARTLGQIRLSLHLVINSVPFSPSVSMASDRAQYHPMWVYAPYVVLFPTLEIHQIHHPSCYKSPDHRLCYNNSRQDPQYPRTIERTRRSNLSREKLQRANELSVWLCCRWRLWRSRTGGGEISTQDEFVLVPVEWDRPATSRRNCSLHSPVTWVN